LPGGGADTTGSGTEGGSPDGAGGFRPGDGTGKNGSGAPGFGGAEGAGGAGGGFGGGAGGILGSTDSLTTAERDVYDYVSAHRDGASYLMAVSSWSDASPYIIATGQEVMPMGGFSGTVPSPTLARVQKLVSTGQLRFFMLDSTNDTGGRAGRGFTAGGFGGGASDNSTVTAIESWVKSTCTTVPAKDYGATSSAASTSSAAGTSSAGTSSAGTSSAGTSSAGTSSATGTPSAAGKSSATVTSSAAETLYVCR
jgi:hypothetical protein